MLLSSLFILSQRGEVIIELQCRRNESRRVVDAFWSACMAPRATSVSLAPSVVVFEHLVFSTCRVKDVVLLGVSHDEGPALLVLEELMMVTRLLHDYLKQLTEPILRENFSVVFQILQELLDHGYPLTTELYWLEKLVPKPTLEVKVRNLLDDAGGMPESPLASRHSGRIGQSFCHSDRLESSMIPWRSSAVFHTTNELLFDVREVHDWVVDADGRVTQSSIQCTSTSLTYVSRTYLPTRTGSVQHCSRDDGISNKGARVGSLPLSFVILVGGGVAVLPTSDLTTYPAYAAFISRG